MYDSDTDLIYMGARYYPGNRARFLSQDPAFLDIGTKSFRDIYSRPLSFHLSSPQNLNSYSYTNNNPLKFVDPTGELQVRTEGATDEQKAEFYKGLTQLQLDVSQNQEIQSYFKSFGVDINEVLTDTGKGPEVYISRNLGSNELGKYNPDYWFNDISISRNIYGQSNTQQMLPRTLIHELAHYANDVGSRFNIKSLFGNVNPDLGQFSWVEDEMWKKYYSGEFSYEQILDGPYGYGSEFILYPEY